MVGHWSLLFENGRSVLFVLKMVGHQSLFFENGRSVLFV